MYMYNITKIGDTVHTNTSSNNVLSETILQHPNFCALCQVDYL